MEKNKEIKFHPWAVEIADTIMELDLDSETVERRIEIFQIVDAVESGIIEHGWVLKQTEYNQFIDKAKNLLISKNKTKLSETYFIWNFYQENWCKPLIEQIPIKLNQQKQLESLKLNDSEN